jgi:PilZ domain
VSTHDDGGITGRKELLLPEPPRTLEMLAEAGGALRIELISRNGLEYRARAPRLRVQPKSTLQARVDAVDGGGYDVELSVRDVEPETKWTVIVRLQVTAMHARPGHRVTQRVRIGERTPLYAMTCRAVETGEQFEVELADLSTTGLAFATDREFHPGDLVALMPAVDGQVMRLRARVLRSEPIDEALNRVGCEIAAITETNRERIARLTTGVADESADRAA